MQTFTSLKSVRIPGYACRKHVTAREHRKKTNEGLGQQKACMDMCVTPKKSPTRCPRPETIKKATSVAKNSRPDKYQKIECPEAEGCVIGHRGQPETRKVVTHFWITRCI